jgi:hypothetical protein
VEMTKDCPKLVLLGLAAMGAGSVPAMAADAGWFWGISVSERFDSPGDGGMKMSIGSPRLRSAVDAGGSGVRLRWNARPGAGSVPERIGASATTAYTLANAGSPNARAVSGLTNAGYTWNADIYGVWPIRRDFSFFAEAGLQVTREGGSLAGEPAAMASSVGSMGIRVSPGLGLGLEYSLTKRGALRSALQRYRWSAGDSAVKEDAYMFSLGADFRF